MKNHIHTLLMIPPKYSVANTIGFLKGKSAIRIFREYLQVKRTTRDVIFGSEDIVSAPSV